MRNRTVAVVLLSSMVFANPAFAASQGGTCKKLGQKVSSQGAQLVCAKSGKKLVWVKKQSEIVTPAPISNTPSSNLPPVVGPAPSDRVIAFYYAWYGNPAVDGKWIHWDQNKSTPPNDIGSDYFPELGAYSSNDLKVIAQHMAWLRQAGVGTIALSHWDDSNAGATNKIFEMAQRYGIKVTFHIEPACNRTANSYASIVNGLVSSYSKQPAFFTTRASSPYLTDNSPKPLIFVWATNFWNNCDNDPLAASAWAPGNDQIHAVSKALMIACPCGGGYSSAVDEGHFDGGYNYATLHLNEEDGFLWARGLPRGALYIPSVIPGNSAERVGYDSNTLVARRDGREYNDQWNAALTTGIAPDFVTITSFNEWHEGSSIEPARSNYSTSRKYKDYESLGATGYLDLTASWVKKFLANEFPATVTTPLRISITTSADWSNTQLTEGALYRPLVVSRSAEAIRSSFTGMAFELAETLQRAEAGQSITAVFEVGAVGKRLSFLNQAGYIGQTTLTVQVQDGAGWRTIKTLSWTGGPNNNMVLSVDLP